MNSRISLRRLAVLGAVSASSIVLTACGSVSVDSSALEKDIDAKISKAPGDVEVASVDCPNDPPSAKGDTFDCTFTLADDSAGEVSAEVTDDEGGTDWNMTRPASGMVEQEVWTSYEEQTGDTVSSIECPDEVKTGDAAETICSIELEDGSAGEVVVTADGDDITWQTR
jgi:hypothetical protein